jgi:hypothetical protein
MVMAISGPARADRVERLRRLDQLPDAHPDLVDLDVIDLLAAHHDA